MTDDARARPATAAVRGVRGVLARAERQLGQELHLVRGSVGVMASTMVAAATGWLFWVVATHRWPTSQIGVATSLVAALTSIALVAGQPIATTMLLRIPRSRHRVALLTAGVLTAVVIACVECALAVGLLPASVGVVRTFGLASLFTCGAVGAAAAIVLDASSLAIRRPGLMVARNGAHGAGKLVLLGALALPAGLVTAPFAVVGAWAALSVATAAWEWRAWHRLVVAMASAERPTRADRAERRAARRGFAELRQGFGLQVVGTLGGALPPQLLPILVVGLLGESAAHAPSATTQAGWFSITWLVGSLCFMISPAVCQALLAEGSLDPAVLDRKTRAAVALSSGLLVGPLAVYLLAGHAVLGLFGASYAAHGTTLLVILAASSVPDLVTNVAVARYRVQGRLRPAAAVNTVIAVVAVGGAAWTLRRHGIDAAGWSWALGEVAGCLVLLFVLALDRRASRVGALAAP